MHSVRSIALTFFVALVISSCSQAVSGGDEKIWTDKLNQGMDAIRQQKWEEAEEYLKASLAEAEKFGPEDKRVSGSLVNLACCYSNAKDYDKAIAASRRAIKIDERVFGPGFEVAYDLNQLGTYLGMAGKYDEATKVLERAVSMRAKLTSAKGLLQLATSLGNLGENMISLKKYPEAERYFREALAIHRTQEAPVDYFMTMGQLERVFEKEKAPEKAEALFVSEFDFLNDKYGPESPWVRVLHSRQGKFYMDRKDYKSAEALYRRLLKVRSQIPAQKGVQTAEAANALAVCLFKQEKYDEALQYFEQALKLMTGASPEQMEAVKANYDDCKAKAGK